MRTYIDVIQILFRVQYYIVLTWLWCTALHNHLIAENSWLHGLEENLALPLAAMPKILRIYPGEPLCLPGG